MIFFPKRTLFEVEFLERKNLLAPKIKKPHKYYLFYIFKYYFYFTVLSIYYSKVTAIFNAFYEAYF